MSPDRQLSTRGQPVSAIEIRKAEAREWFEYLRDTVIDVFEQLERDALDTLYPILPGRFEKTPWSRSPSDDGCDQGGGVMGMMRGRLFEKVGVHTSTVYGAFAADFAKQVKGAADDPRFWASGISLIAHPRNPNIPAVHLNTRMIVTTEAWFGGGTDLNPTLAVQRARNHPDAQDFHTRLKVGCDRFDATWYEKYTKWADDYFWLPHRAEHRGVGGIFYDHHSSGDWGKDFAFTRAIGEAFRDIYPTIVRRHMAEPWSERDRAEQAKWRGRYVEFNLLYDRGTTFGLKTGGNVESILSSMPPVAEWL